MAGAIGESSIEEVAAGSSDNLLGAPCLTQRLMRFRIRVTVCNQKPQLEEDVSRFKLAGQNSCDTKCFSTEEDIVPKNKAGEFAGPDEKTADGWAGPEKQTR